MLFTWLTGLLLECRLQRYSGLKSTLDPITAVVREISAFFSDQYLAEKKIQEHILK